MSSISDPVGFTTNVLTLLSFSMGAIAASAGYTSFCATSGRQQAAVALLDHWAEFIKELNDADKQAFELVKPGELARISRVIKRLRSSAASMTVELDNNRWWRYFPASEVCGQFRDWNATIQQATQDFYTTTEMLRGMQTPNTIRAEIQVPASQGTQGGPRVDINKAIRWLNTVKARLPDVRLRGIVNGLNAVMVSQC